MRSPAAIMLLLVAACGGPAKPTTTVTTGGGSAATTATATGDDAPLAMWKSVRTGKLSKGLTYYVVEHHKPEKRAYLWLAVNAGSTLEDDDQKGLAHFDEHMAFNGTKRFPQLEIVNYLQSIGMRFGADLNARTTFDDTMFQLEVPTDNDQFVAKGFDILRDWAGDVTYAKEDVDKERGVVLEEWRGDRSAGMRLFEKHAKALLAGTKYQDRIPIGSPDVIKGAPRDALYRFYKDWYRPDLMAVIAVGDFKDAAAIEKEIKERFADLKNPDKERPRASPGVPKADGPHVSIQTDPELTTTQINVANLMPHRPQISKRDARRVIVEIVFLTILNERLSSIARRSDAPFLAASASVDHPAGVRDIDEFDRGAIIKDGQTDEAIKSLFTEVLRIERFGVSDGELERARAIIAKQAEVTADSEDTKDGRELAEELSRNFFDHEFVIGAAREKDMYLEFLPTITVADLNALNTSYGGKENRVIAISVPDGKPVPKEGHVLELIDQVRKLDIQPWQDKGGNAVLMAAAPTPGKVTKETKIDKLGVTEWTLSNGARVVVKPTEFKRDEVQIIGSGRGGLSGVQDAQFNNARVADNAAAVGGAGELDAETLQKILAGKHAEVTTSIDDTLQGVVGGGSSKDLETILQLVYLKVAQPRQDPEQFGVWKKNTVELLTTRHRDPEFVYITESRAAEYNNAFRGRYPEAKDIDKVDFAKSFAFYKERFSDVSDYTFVIVGDVDLAKLKPLVETYLASLPGKGRKDKERDLGLRKVPGVVKRVWKLGSEPKAHVTLEFHGDETWSRDKDRDMAILSQVLGMRLREILREDLGGTYSVDAGGVIYRAPHQERSFTVSFGCAPDAVDRLINATFEEIKRLQKEGIPGDYLDKVKAQTLRERETEQKTNGYWVEWLNRAYRFGDDPTLVLDPSGIVARMTSDNVKAAARKYLDVKTYFQWVMLPAQAPAPTEPPKK